MGSINIANTPAELHSAVMVDTPLGTCSVWVDHRGHHMGMWRPCGTLDGCSVLKDNIPKTCSEKTL